MEGTIKLVAYTSMLLATLAMTLSCNRLKKAVEAFSESEDSPKTVEVQKPAKKQTNQKVIDLGDGRKLHIENPDALEIWEVQSRTKYLLLGSDYGIGIGLFINPENIEVSEDKPWDELSGLILWNFGVVKEPGDTFACYGGDMCFHARVGSKMVYVDGQYLGGEEDWIVNEFRFRNRLGTIKGVISIYYEGGDVYFDDIISHYSDEEVLLRLAAMSLAEAIEAGFDFSEPVYAELENFQ